MTKAEEIFNTKAEYNKWLKELTNDEKELVLEMINEALHQSNTIEQSKELKSEEQVCYKNNEPCKYDCSGLCKESC